MLIRPATEKDTPALLDMGRKFYVTTSYSEWVPYDPPTVAALVDLMREGVLLVAEEEGRLIGMAGLVVMPFLFNRSVKGAYEVMWWVDPSAQGQGAGKALLSQIEPACRAKGCAAVQMVHLENSPIHAGKLYERMGYHHTETAYTKLLR